MPQQLISASNVVILVGGISQNGCYHIFKGRIKKDHRKNECRKDDLKGFQNISSVTNPLAIKYVLSYLHFHARKTIGCLSSLPCQSMSLS